MLHNLVFLFYISLPANFLQQPQLIGNWKVTEIISNGKSIGADIPMNISLQFLPDGKVIAHMDEKTEMGRWKIEGEFLILFQPKTTEKFRFQLQGNRLNLIKDAEMIVLTKQG